MNKIVGISSLAIAALIVGCSSSAKKEATNTTSIESKQVAMEQEASYVTEFSFNKGSAALTGTAKDEMRRMINQAKEKGEIKELKVITWGDSEYPSTNTKKLSSAEIDLVKKRNKAISDYAKTVIEGIDVDTHSMAERPGALKELFNTSDAQIKKSLETAGIPTTDTAVKVPSKASKSIVMVIRE